MNQKDRTHNFYQKREEWKKKKRNHVCGFFFSQNNPVVVSVLWRIISMNLKNYMFVCEYLCLDNKLGSFGSCKTVVCLCIRNVNNFQWYFLEENFGASDVQSLKNFNAMCFIMKQLAAKLLYADSTTIKNHKMV